MSKKEDDERILNMTISGVPCTDAEIEAVVPWLFFVILVLALGAIAFVVL